MIIDDVLSCYKKGRKSLLLTGRVDHVEKLGNILKEKVSNVFCLTGGMGLKKTAEKIGAVKSVKDSEPFIIVSIGSFIGEGFDEPRLDTLFLAMPVSWKGTLQQYTGRLHRESCNKKDVLVYDYIDLHVKMLDNMYHKRLKAYALIGYKAKENSFSDSPTKIIYNKENFFPVYLKDIANTSKKLIIISPFVTKIKIECSR